MGRLEDPAGDDGGAIAPAFSAWTNGEPRLHLASWEGAGPPLLLVHGMAGNTHWWDSCGPILARDFSPAALDFSGHGESGRRKSYDTAGWVDDIDQARHALGWPRMTLLAHSLGARIALEYAARHPERLSALIAVDFLPETHAERSRTFIRARSRPAPVYPDLETTVEHFRLQPRGTLLTQEQLQALGRQSARKTPQGWTWKFDWSALLYDYAPIWPTLPRLRVPTLLVRGENSEVMTAKDLERAHKELPGSQVLTIAKAHHHVPLDTPEELCAAVSEFASKLASG